ncbi:DUF937 domain-containing protein [Riemerella columbipharyngis]|uniref:DUF937 domain-containing protein n=1 Tax=Riemerella columbipharyngis TaxID=1071918 RepID=A0A1G7FEC4_9FLAO|nr:DUF937 domain-containing protein [Riemerella columbipharyngis]SDE74177.1 hypothetical protein SAMN05421544_12210 [Riemerella columbipharyngis]
MHVNIIELVKGQFGAAVTSQLAEKLGESEAGVFRAVNTFIPVILTRIISCNEHSTILKAATNISDSDTMQNLNLDTVKDDPVLTELLSAVFGDKVNTVIFSVAQTSGVKEVSAKALFKFTSFYTLGMIGRYAKDHNLNAEKLKSILEAKKNDFYKLLPTEISLKSIGLGNFNTNENTDELAENTHTETTNKVTNNTAKLIDNLKEDTKDNYGKNIITWLVPLVLLILTGIFFVKTLKNKQEPNTEVATAKNPKNILNKKIDSIKNSHSEKKDSIFPQH